MRVLISICLLFAAAYSQCNDNSDCTGNLFCNDDLGSASCEGCPANGCSNVGLTGVGPENCYEVCGGRPCTLNDDCAGETELNFCEVDLLGNSGFCVKCSEIDQSSDLSGSFENAVECLTHASFDHWKASYACLTACEGGQLEQAALNHGIIIDGESISLGNPGGACTNSDGSESMCDPEWQIQTVAGYENERNSVSGLCTNCCDANALFRGLCAAYYDNDNHPCKTSRCEDPAANGGSGGGACVYEIAPNDQVCTMPHKDELGTEFAVLGKCLDGNCIVHKSGHHSEPADCPSGTSKTVKTTRVFGPCAHRQVIQDFEFSGEACPAGAQTNCDQFGVQWKDVVCWSSSFLNETGQFDVHYHDPTEMVPTNMDEGRCMIGFEAGCVINTSGFFSFRGMNIIFMAGETSGTKTSLMTIDFQTKTLSPYLKCLGDGSQFCRGLIDCSMKGDQPCDYAYPVCIPPTLPPTSDPTHVPSTSTTAHGDPIIWTFNEDCYDLNKDGLYLATSHPIFDHDVKIAVHNDFMREIQVVDAQGKIMLAINNLGEVLNNNFPFFFSEETKKCPPNMDAECPFEFKEFKFDAQNFEYVVQTLAHDYFDPALKPGQMGVHLDIFVKPYRAFAQNKAQYTGLYFDNPLPEELEYCQGGSRQY